ncbi:MAG TPA: hypothetical protein VFZ00_11185 [Solirubrobacter sp.]|nr:hypothetical protein [Solirubrobacter sp.]
MQTVQLEILNAEEEAAKNAAVAAENEQKERERIAMINRVAGHRRPEPGDRFYVTTAGLARRGRAGVLFERGRRTDILVVDDLAPAESGLRGDQIVVSVAGAERILADDALTVFTRPATEVEAAGLRSQLADREAELAKAKAEIERLRREARMSAPADPNGGPARLRAAKKVTEPEGFGGKD